MKVAQVGRSVVERILHGEPNYGVFLDPDAVEAACLAHDLGHPPFGHNTERALDRILRSKTPGATGESVLVDGFEGNAQTFRVVTTLSVRYQNDQVGGLNLCRATLNALLKYPWLRESEGPRGEKFGSYISEREDFEFARSGSPSGIQSVEAQLMDWADDVTYAVHDVEDFFRAGLVPLERLSDPADKVERESFLARMVKTQAMRSDGFTEDEISSALDSMRIAVPGPFRGTRADRAALRTYTSLLIHDFVVRPTITFLSESGFPQLEIPRDVRVRVAVLKAITTYYVIERPSVLAQRFGQRHVVQSLFDMFYEAATEDEQRDLPIFPAVFQERVKQLGNTQLGPIKRLIADVIASMSEGQLIDTHLKLTGQSLGSVVDPII
jgi:dGTPase